MRAEVYRTIAVRENNKEVHLPGIQVALRSLVLQAAKGSTRAQLAMTRLLTEADQRTSDRIMADITAVAEYQMRCEEEFRCCDKAGKPRPETVPHPDEIAIHPGTGEIIFNGPSNKREKAIWDKLIKTRDDFAAENEILKKERRRAKTDTEREFYDREIQFNQKIIDLADQTFPSEKMRRAPDFNIKEWRLKQPLLQAEIAKRRKCNELLPVWWTPG